MSTPTTTSMSLTRLVNVDNDNTNSPYSQSKPNYLHEYVYLSKDIYKVGRPVSIKYYLHCSPALIQGVVGTYTLQLLQPLQLLDWSYRLQRLGKNTMQRCNGNDMTLLLIMTNDNHCQWQCTARVPAFRIYRHRYIFMSTCRLLLHVMWHSLVILRVIFSLILFTLN